GDTLEVSVRVNNPQRSRPREVYVGVLFPDGATALLFGRDGRPIASVRLSGHPDLVPTTTLPAGGSLDEPSFFRGPIPADAAPGTYEFFVAIVVPPDSPESAARGRRVLAADVQAVSFSR